MQCGRMNYVEVIRNCNVAVAYPEINFPLWLIHTARDRDRERSRDWNEEFIYCAFNCTHYRGAGPGNREQGTGLDTNGLHTHFPVPSPIQCE